jgi:hypothetical protein
MTLITGSALDPKAFFKEGQPSPKGSSFDLTIGSIFDHEGKKVEGLFTLKPGHMVQVVSAEVFKLSDRVTGHVTYKTTLTKRGIWALTVGLVDPGWDGPIATTLLNFSRVDHTIATGDAFLRVSLFDHNPVPSDKLRNAPPLKQYLTEVQKTAASMFPPTFLDSDKIAEVAGRKILSQIRTEALVWVVAIAFLFTMIQVIVNATRGEQTHPVDTQTDLNTIRARIEALQVSQSKLVTQTDLDALRARIEALQANQSKFERANSPTPTPQAPAPPAPPTPVAPSK